MFSDVGQANSKNWKEHTNFVCAECWCWSSQEHSRKELIAQHTQKSCALFLSCCLLDQHQKTLAGLVIALLVPRTAASTIKQVGQFGILLASTLCYNLFGYSRHRTAVKWQQIQKSEGGNLTRILLIFPTFLMHEDSPLFSMKTIPSEVSSFSNGATFVVVYATSAA